MKATAWKTRLNRRKFLGAAGAFCLGGAGYMRFWEPGWLQVGRYRVPLGSRAPIKLLHLSDFHASEAVSLGFINEAIELGISLKPDLACLTGDFITWKYDQFGDYGRILKKLSDHVPAFAVLGNHDGGRWAAHRGYSDTSLVQSMLAAAGIRLLHNSAAEIQVSGQAITLVGVGDLWARELDASSAFAQAPLADGGVTILLSHNPDSKASFEAHRWDLMLCGHTHGGQMRVPLIGYPFAPVRDHRFVEGLHRWNGRWLYITRGVGNLHGVRLNCPPEVSLLEIA